MITINIRVSISIFILLEVLATIGRE